MPPMGFWISFKHSGLKKDFHIGHSIILKYNSKLHKSSTTEQKLNVTLDFLKANYSIFYIGVCNNSINVSFVIYYLICHQKILSVDGKFQLVNFETKGLNREEICDHPGSPFKSNISTWFLKFLSCC